MKSTLLLAAAELWQALMHAARTESVAIQDATSQAAQLALLTNASVLPNLGPSCVPSAPNAVEPSAIMC